MSEPIDLDDQIVVDNPLDVFSTEFQTFILGRWASVDVDPYVNTFPCLPQVRTGHTKVFAPRATLGPPDPNIDDTLSTLNYMDLTGGQGISRINVSTDLSMFWWSTADTRWADGWTCGPEVFEPPTPETQRDDPALAAIELSRVRPPAGEFVGECIPVGRIGDSMYALWGGHLHRWDPDELTWSGQLVEIGPTVGDPVLFNGRAFFPLGESGYCYVSEIGSDPGVALQFVAGVDSPTSHGPEDVTPTSPPKVWRFGIYRQQLWALTTQQQGHGIASATTGLLGNAWFWPMLSAVPGYPKVLTDAEPRVLVNWMRPDGQPALWCICRRGGLIYNDDEACWTETNLWNVPPHPNFGRAAIPWRPGEALWITSGGGDAFQYTASNVAQPAQGPGGRRDGMPWDRRGDIVSFASDLANLYCLVQTPRLVRSTSIVEDEPADPLSVPQTFIATSVLANTGKGWHPLWETTAAEGTPSRIVVSDHTKDEGDVDYRTFWGVGSYCYSMSSRLTTYSSRQGRQNNPPTTTDTNIRNSTVTRFAKRSYIEFGEFNAGAISTKKLFSHMAILLEDASPLPGQPDRWPGYEYVQFEYRTDQDGPQDWRQIGAWMPPDADHTVSWWRSDAVASAWMPRARTILPFGMSDDGRWSSGIANYWIKPRITLVGPGGLSSPTVQALSLAYMPLPQDAAHQVYTIPLPVETDERTGKTREQIYNILKEHLISEEMLFLQFQERTYRAYVAGLSVSEIAAKDYVGAITLNVIQVPTGVGSLVGERH